LDEYENGYNSGYDAGVGAALGDAMQEAMHLLEDSPARAIIFIGIIRMMISRGIPHNKRFQGFLEAVHDMIDEYWEGDPNDDEDSEE
jgi:hypothetical protein